MKAAPLFTVSVVAGRPVVHGPGPGPEVVIYDRPLTPQEWALVGAYWREKYEGE